MPRWQPSKTKNLPESRRCASATGDGPKTVTRLSGLAGNHEDPGTETPAIKPKSPYCGNSGATIRRQVGRERGRGGAGMTGAHPIGPWRKLPAQGGNFRVICGGGRCSSQGVGGAGLAAQRSVPSRQEPGSAKECAGHGRPTAGVWWRQAVGNGWRGFSCPGPLSPTSNNHTAIF